MDQADISRGEIWLRDRDSLRHWRRQCSESDRSVSDLTNRAGRSVVMMMRDVMPGFLPGVQYRHEQPYQHQ